MSHQLTFADSEFNNKRRKTRKELFLSRMNELMLWDPLEAVIEPFYPKAGNGRRPYPVVPEQWRFKQETPCYFWVFPVEKLFSAIIALKILQNMGRNKATSVAYVSSGHRYLRSR